MEENILKNLYEFKKLFIESMSTLRVKRNVKGVR